MARGRKPVNHNPYNSIGRFKFQRTAKSNIEENLLINKSPVLDPGLRSRLLSILDFEDGIDEKSPVLYGIKF